MLSLKLHVQGDGGGGGGGGCCEGRAAARLGSSSFCWAPAFERALSSPGCASAPAPPLIWPQLGPAVAGITDIDAAAATPAGSYFLGAMQNWANISAGERVDAAAPALAGYVLVEMSLTAIDVLVRGSAAAGRGTRREAALWHLM